MTAPTEAPAAPRRFAALRNRDCRPYLVGVGLGMMADNIEHVITYWVLWQRFHSPTLAGFQVISHWVPFLLLSVWFGALADRFDCRRVIQVSQVLFMSVSAAWGVLFLTGTLQTWHACVLLVLHGCAGAMWGPAEQLMLHDFVGDEDLPSAVRLNATFRSIGVLCGPVVGSGLMLLLGTTGGIFANVAFYLPLTIFLAFTRFTGHSRGHASARPAVNVFGSLRVLRRVGSDRTLISMIILAGLASFFVGTAVQAAMPDLAEGLGAGSSGFAYGVLLFAAGAGGVVGGLVLESTRWLRETVPTAVLTTVVFGLSTCAFAFTRSYLVAVPMLFVGGIASLAATSIGQTVVQLRADAADRGQVVGVYNVAASGLRFGSGLVIGVLGQLIGLHGALAAGSAALTVGALAAGLYGRRSRRPASRPGQVPAAVG
jgi:MFS family permease